MEVLKRELLGGFHFGRIKTRVCTLMFYADGLSRHSAPFHVSLFLPGGVVRAKHNLCSFTVQT